MIADLAMYDWPGTRAANDAFWAEVVRRLRAAGIAAPDRLARAPDPGSVWRDPAMVLSQTCGMPYVAGHCGGAEVVGRPDYGLDGAEGGTYCSVIVVRAADAGPLAAMEGCRVAVNEPASFSGHVALRAHLAAERGGAATPFFGATVLSGRHVDSARMVARGEADLAALDRVAWELLQRQEAGTAGQLAEIARTRPGPALPFITAPALAHQSETLRAALDGAARAMPAQAGIPRAVLAADDRTYDATREVARLAAREPFSPDAPRIPALAGR